jgi:PPM family protein phosphatase
MSGDLFRDTAEHPSHGPTARVRPPRPFSSLVRVDVAARSHPGRVRPNNEDHFLVARAGRSLQMLATNLEDGCVPDEFTDAVYAMAVADGVGGLAAGEVASRMALAAFVGLVLNTPDWIFGASEPEEERILARAAERFRDVNAALIEQARRDPALATMGSTLTVAWSFGADLYIAHLGDSRVCLFHRGALHKLTRDHTVAQALADVGQITPEEAATHRLRHILTRALGMPEGGGSPEVQRLRLADGDRVLLCTDGLTDMVEDAAIAAELGRAAPAA